MLSKGSGKRLFERFQFFSIMNCGSRAEKNVENTK